MFDHGSPEREVALVVLQAAVLNRRIFLNAPSGELEPIHWQVLITIALANPLARGPETGETVRGIRSILTLEPHPAWEAIATLRDLRLIRKERHSEDAPDDQVILELTDKGQAAAREFIERAARFLPGWPPDAPTTE